MEILVYVGVELDCVELLVLDCWVELMVLVGVELD